MTVTIRPGRAAGTVPAPSSKSMTHRLLLAAALAPGESVLRGVLQSEDILATLDCLTALGAGWALNGDTLTIRGGGTPKPQALFPCRESGSTLRFCLPLALTGREAVFTGSPRLMERGVEVYARLLEPRGVAFRREARRLTVQGTLTPGDFILPGNVSSQFVTGLLFALPRLAGDSTLRVLPPLESRPYLDMTLAALARAGIAVRETQPGVFFIPGHQVFRPVCGTVEGDWSNAAALLCLNAAGGAVAVSGLDPDSTQGDRVFPAALAALRGPDPGWDLSDCPDLGPVLFAAAALLGRGGTFTGTRRLRLKESDRAAAMAQELEKFGLKVLVEEERVILPAGRLHAPEAALSGHNDHRIVMALAVLSSVTGGTITGAQAVKKSYPGFFDALRTLGLVVEEQEEAPFEHGI